MQLSNLPAKIARIWANAASVAYVRPIPAASQQQITPGAASFDDGFPPACFLSTTSGGIPPAGADFNGIIQQITAWNRWQAAGGTVPYDQTFANAIGGYPYGAIVQSKTPGKLWFSTADQNSTDPDSSSAANWQAFLPGGLTTKFISGRVPKYYGPGSFTLAIPAGNAAEIAECRGPGGGGAGAASQSAPASGGGGGGYCYKVISAMTDVVLAISVAPSNPGGAAGANFGLGGGTTSITVQSGTVLGVTGTIYTAGQTLCAATGGGGGYVSGASVNPPGGGASGGDLNVAGDTGALPVGPFQNGTFLGGQGGSSYGFPQPQTSQGGQGNASSAPGVGGNGAAGNAAGGPGQPGRVIIFS